MFESQDAGPAIPRGSVRGRWELVAAIGLSLGVHAGVVCALVLGAWTMVVAGGSAVGDPGVPSSVVELTPGPTVTEIRPVPLADSTPPPLIIATGDGPGVSADSPAPRLESERPAAKSSAAITGLAPAAVQTTLRADASAAPGAMFAGVGTASARSVVYVVDASGPMVGALPEVFSELRASVDRLKPTQRFGVVVFRHTPDGGTTESFAASPIRATDQAKVQLAAWLDSIRPSGRSNPLDGLRAALAMNPDAVFLLSRSIERSGGGVWDLGKDPTLAELDRLNPRETGGHRRVAIRTIQFIDEDPTGTMQAIAREHAGANAGNAAPGDSGAEAYTVIRRAGELAR
jgi:hypothetical protein